MFQSTHPRGVRHHAPDAGQSGPVVSIHAPAWGATWSWPFTGTIPGMFQSTHPRGVRRFRTFHYWMEHRCFNPRTRVGCDAVALIHGIAGRMFQSTHPRGVRRASATFLAATARVSIHAPAWGATWYTSQTSSPLLSFNPRTRVGCDINADIDRWNYDQFQSTHPRGVRHRQRPAASVPAAVSIHAPAWGATHAILLFQQTKIQFQSTHPRGVRP